MEKNKIWKKCPRCGEKNYVANKAFENCKLIFARLEYASSKKAKEAIIKREKEKILMTTEFPKDLSRIKAVLLCLFGGWIGLHNIYVKRYIKGFFSLFFSILTGVLVLLLDGAILANAFNTILFVPGATVFIFWFYDFLMLLLKKYKVPIALDMPKEEESGK